MCPQHTGGFLKFWELLFSPRPQSFHHGAHGAAVTLGNWQGRGGAEDPSEGIWEVLDLLTVLPHTDEWGLKAAHEGFVEIENRQISVKRIIRAWGFLGFAGRKLESRLHLG